MNIICDSEASPDNFQTYALNYLKYSLSVYALLHFPPKILAYKTIYRNLTFDMQVNKQQLELDMEQWTGSKLGKEYIKAVYCHPAYLTYVQSTS